MKKLKQYFLQLKMIRRVELVLSILCTVFLLVIFPAFAWFSYVNRMETMTKIKEPDNLDIKAGNFDQIINFEIRDVDIEKMVETGVSEYRVFSVSAGDYMISYYLQLAHTTNIPFTYKIYRATRLDEAGDGSGVTVQYHPLDNADAVTEYQFDPAVDEITLTLKNGDASNESHFGRTLAMRGEDTYYKRTYAENDDPEIYAVPLYYESERIIPTQKEKGDHDYFVLEIGWAGSPSDETGFKEWNKAVNNKETDIVLLTASRSTN
ncbi:MAG: hypothetical protein K6F51_14440 [Acetatifactor sp.]|nr:hypothetical protein [Acetatifactor sp.]